MQLFHMFYCPDLFMCLISIDVLVCLINFFSINLSLIFSDRVQGNRITYTGPFLHAFLSHRASSTSQPLDSEQLILVLLFIHFIKAGSLFWRVGGLQLASVGRGIWWLTEMW